jgi:hypothetical protein
MKNKTFVAGVVTSLVCTLGATGIAVPAFANPTDTVTADTSVPRPLSGLEKYSLCVENGMSKAKWAKKNPNTFKAITLGNKIANKCERRHMAPDTRPAINERPVTASEVYVNAKGQTVFPLNRRINYDLMTWNELTWIATVSTDNNLDVNSRGVNGFPRTGNSTPYMIEMNRLEAENSDARNTFIDAHRGAASAYWNDLDYLAYPQVDFYALDGNKVNFDREDPQFYESIARWKEVNDKDRYVLYDYPAAVGITPWTSDTRLTPVMPWTVEQGFEIGVTRVDVAPRG